MRPSRTKRNLVGVAAFISWALAAGCGLTLGVSMPTAADASVDAQDETRDAGVLDSSRFDAPYDASSDASSDAGFDAPADVAPDTASDAGTRRVFLTNANYMGNQIGGVAGADVICNQIAVNLGGKWHAILGENETYAQIITRIGNRVAPIVKVDNGKVIAPNIAALLNAKPTLSNPINFDQTGGVINNSFAWTGISVGNGATGASTNHCVKWTSNAQAQMGIYGEAKQTDGQFLMRNGNNATDTCDVPHRLYCIEE
ncbi:MAG: hypothetical protein U0174_11515 [Polyangiaceae bacterium]